MKFFRRDSRNNPDAYVGAVPADPELRGGRRIIWITLMSVAAFTVWAAYAEIDQITRAPAQVIPTSRTQVVQSSDGGVVEDMLVRAGDEVERGQLLVRIDRTKVEAAYLEARARAAGVAAVVARLRAEVFNRPPEFDPIVADYPQFRANQLSLLEKRRASFREEIAALENQRAIVDRELRLTEPLLKTGDVSTADVLRLQRQIADIDGQITNRRNKYFQDVQAEMSKAEEDLATLMQALAQRKDQLERTELRAPARGIVKNVRVTTPGAVLRAGEEVLQIVPADDALIFEARVKPVDIGFLKPGLAATIKVDAYDFGIYGGLDGKVTYISADTLSEDLRQGEQPYYRVQLQASGRTFSKRRDDRMDIQPGMTATVEIKTGSNTVLRYLTKPLIKTLEESLTER
jgi:adhesin transport system membrane fusion protein